MKMKSRSLFVATAAGMLAAGIAMPASAADSADTPLTILITGGALNISAPSGSVEIGSLGSPTDAASDESELLGEVKVTDARSVTSGGWVASVSSTDFESGQGNSIPNSAVGYEVGDYTHTGTVTLDHDDRASLASAGGTPDDTTGDPTGAYVVMTATEVDLDNSATWDPTIKVAVPVGIAAGTYTATITHSVV